jgi:hypothetical protein
VTCRYVESWPPAPTDPTTGERLPTPGSYVDKYGARFVANFGAPGDLRDEPPSEGNDFCKRARVIRAVRRELRGVWNLGGAEAWFTRCALGIATSFAHFRSTTPYMYSIVRPA